MSVAAPLEVGGAQVDRVIQEVVAPTAQDSLGHLGTDKVVQIDLHKLLITIQINAVVEQFSPSFRIMFDHFINQVGAGQRARHRVCLGQEGLQAVVVIRPGRLPQQSLEDLALLVLHCQLEQVEAVGAGRLVRGHHGEHEVGPPSEDEADLVSVSSDDTLCQAESLLAFCPVLLSSWNCLRVNILGT